MSDAKDVFRVVGMIVLGGLVLFVILPLVLQLIGITIGILVHLAVGLIYVAVALAIGYVMLVGIRALLR